jgi:hypothetical protein
MAARDQDIPADRRIDYRVRSNVGDIMSLVTISTATA